MKEEVWLEYMDTLKACFIIMGAVRECEEIERGVIRCLRDPLKRINKIFEFYIEKVSVYG